MSAGGTTALQSGIKLLKIKKKKKTEVIKTAKEAFGRGNRIRIWKSKNLFRGSQRERTINRIPQILSRGHNENCNLDYSFPNSRIWKTYVHIQAQYNACF